MINLYKMPGAFIFGFHGNFGTGKTLGLVEQGIITASKHGLNLVSSFDISQYWTNRYCEHKKLTPIRTKVINIDTLEDEIKRARERIAGGKLGRFSRAWLEMYEQEGMTPLLFLFSQERSVILLDEAGLALFSRNFKDTSRSILFKEMFQLRKGSSFLFFSCQHLGQIDKQLRDNTHVWLLCKGLQKFNAKKKRSILISRSVVAFTTEQFEVLMSKPQNRNKLIYPIFLSGFKFSTSNLMLSKFLGLISHLRKGLSYARKKTKSKKVGLLWAIFYEMHYLEKYFKNLDYISEEDLLFKVYNSFGKVGNKRQKGYRTIIYDPEKAEKQKQESKALDYTELLKEEEPEEKPQNGKVKNDHGLEAFLKNNDSL